VGARRVLAAAGWLATPWYVRTTLLPALWAQYGLRMTTERHALSVAEGTPHYTGLRGRGAAEGQAWTQQRPRRRS